MFARSAQCRYCGCRKGSTRPRIRTSGPRGPLVRVWGWFRGPQSERSSACAEAGVAVLLSGHTHTPSAGVVDLHAPGVDRRALALVTGTAISTRTRGAANAYEVIQMEGSMSDGERITVEIREPTSTGWSERRKSHFRYTSSGVVDEWQPG